MLDEKIANSSKIEFALGAVFGLPCLLEGVQWLALELSEGVLTLGWS